MTPGPAEEKFVKWLRGAVRRNLPAMTDSAIFFALWSKSYEEDSLTVLQFGLAVLLDKPIYVAVPRGTVLPDNVRRLARLVVEFTGPDDMPDAVKRIAAHARAAGIITP